MPSIRYFFLALFCGCIAVAQERPISVRGLDPSKSIAEYRHSVWTAENGLPQNSVQTLCQTRNGYIWIGTQEGLVRFDGLNFMVFDKTNAPAISDKFVNALLETSDGTLWGGGARGCLFSLQNGVFTRQAIDQQADVRVLAEWHGRVWIGTNRGLYYWQRNAATLRRLSVSDGLPSDAILSLAADTTAGILWVGTQEGLCAVRIAASNNDGVGDTFRTHSFGVGDGLVNAAIRALLCDREGTLWIGSNGGLQRAIWSDGAFRIVETYTERSGLSDNVITALHEDTERTLWIGTATQGLMRCTASRRIFERFTIANGLGSNDVDAIIQDREGMLWIGSANGGALNRLANASFIGYTKSNGLIGEFAWTLLQSRDGSMYFNTSNAGVARLKSGAFSFFTKERNGLLSNAGRAMMEDAEGVLWVGSAESGVSCVKNGRVVKTYTTATGLLGDNIRVLFEDSKRRVWIGSFNSGLQCLEHGKFTSWTEKNGLCGNKPRTVLESSDGTIWIGTSGGLNALRPGASKLEQYTTVQGLTMNSVLSLHEDESGALWLGMNRGGLHRYKNGKFTHCSIEHGLFDENVYSILDDGLGNFWMSCNFGVFRVSKAELNAFMDGRAAHIVCTVFGKADGMPVAECNGGSTPSAWRSGDGRLWFANAVGVVVVDPRKIYKNPVPPQVILEEMRVDGKPSTSATILATETEKLEFQYTATCLAAAERVKFKYILEGYDKDWVEAGNRRTAYYTNLQRGRDYRFRVIACNNDGVWNETGAWINFSITPFWWEMWQFYGLCVMFVGTTAYQGFRWRTRRLRARARELERLVAKRTKEVQMQAADIETANTALHEKNIMLERQQQILEEQAREIEIANSALQEKNITLEMLNQEKNEFLGIAAHDLKNPLQHIIMVSEKIERYYDRMKRDDIVHQAKTIGAVAHRMNEIIVNLLDINAIERGGVRLAPKEVDIEPLVRRVTEDYVHTAQEKNIAIFVVGMGTETPAFADETAVTQVLDNLISNAIKYSPHGKSVFVRVKSGVEAIRLEVEDEGPGISPEDMQKLFGKFARLSARPTGGEHSTGLGLSIVKKMVEAMNGRVWCESEFGKGATFIVELPTVS